MRLVGDLRLDLGGNLNPIQNSRCGFHPDYHGTARLAGRVS
jgi:hypothetical protein